MDSIHASMALTPDVPHSPPSLVGLDPAIDAGLAEGLAALESYKKKDVAKGQRPLNCPGRSGQAKKQIVSCCTLQGSWKRADNEAELFQSDSFQSLPGRHSVSPQRARMENGRTTGEYVPPGISAFCTQWIFIQFTYINLAFSPAPDDTIANLYRVSLFAHLYLRPAADRQKSFATDGHLIVNYR